MASGKHHEPQIYCQIDYPISTIAGTIIGDHIWHSASPYAGQYSISWPP